MFNSAPSRSEFFTRKGNLDPLAFYYPLRLGIRRRVTLAQKENSQTTKLVPRKQSWREGVGISSIEYEEHPETQVLERLLDSGPTKRFELILGEPGAGKTTLLETWFLRLAQGLKMPKWGTIVPALVRLRSVPRETWQINDDQKMADALWEFASAEKALLEAGAADFYKSERARAFQIVWLLDGLDELSPSSQDERLYQKLVNLHGAKVISARTAVYESIRRNADRYKSHEYELLSLKPTEQEDFLYKRMGDDEDQAQRTFKNIRQSLQMRLLAGNPLMLTLMGDLSKESGQDIDLPDSRAEFYRRAIDIMWHRKLKTDEAALRLREERDAYLTQQAAEMGLETLRAELSVKNPCLERGLRHSGLIRVDDITGIFEFVHLTFQEYYLARGLSKRGLTSVLKTYWSNSRYEEALGLLISILFEEKRSKEIESSIRWLVAWGQDARRKRPAALRKLGSSPLRVALHAIARSAVPLEHNKLVRLFGFLQRMARKRRKVWKLSVAADPLMPFGMLAQLAHDKDEDVREEVAENANTSPKLLAQLAQDPNEDIREAVAENANTSPKLLAQLAQDPNEGVREAVAGNESTPQDILTRLADDEDDDVRDAVADNERTPLEVKALLRSGELASEHEASKSQETLARLARHTNAEQRKRVAMNVRTPPRVLADLAEDQDKAVREEVAWNASTTPDVLLRLARDSYDSQVRQNVAWNAHTTPEILALLARDKDGEVRRRVAWSPVATPEILTGLAEDADARVRGAVALNVENPLEILTRLAEDPNELVRQGVAQNVRSPMRLLSRLGEDSSEEVRVAVAFNVSTLPEMLERLAEDKSARVRSALARNTSVPSEGLDQLAKDEDWKIRNAVAEHENTKPEILGRLALDWGPDVRKAVAENAHTPPKTLARLAKDRDSDVRYAVASNVSTPPEVLSLLAKDKDEDVRWSAARNINILLEDLD